MPRPDSPFALTPSDLITLQDWMRMSTLGKALVEQTRILLLLGDGMTPKAVIDQVQVTRPTVFKWRKRYLEAVLRDWRICRAAVNHSSLWPEKINEILRLTTKRVPKEATHWSVRLMAKYAGVSTWQVRQLWAASDLKPHRLKIFKISNDPHFADKVGRRGWALFEPAG